MGQRLGVASALLGDPRVVVLDEPVNGLDPEGVLWMRTLLRSLADEGRTVFVSSHLMTEMALTATRLVVIGRGRLIADTTVERFVASASSGAVVVRSPQALRLRDALLAPGVTVSSEEPEVLVVQGVSAEQVGDTAFRQGVQLHELTARSASLEEAFMELTRDAVEYRAHGDAQLAVAA
jgi:ABC-2 type transport system ATP-binding protein